MMKWISLNPQLGGEPLAKAFRRSAHDLAGTMPGSIEAKKIRAGFSRSDDNVARAAGLLLCDLHDQGHALRVNRGVIQFSESAGEGEVDSDSIRARLMAARAHQLRSRAVQEFIASVEKRRFHAGAWTSIFSLMRDGSPFSQDLRKLRSGAVPFCQVMDPYLQIVEPDACCEFTGLELVAIWRYFRHTWANPYQSVPGRSFMALIRDAAAPSHPVIGIAGLASSAVQLAVRDRWIGWNPEQVSERLRTEADDSDMAWLANMIDKGLHEIYLDDLLDPTNSPLTRRHLRLPNKDIVEWLRTYSLRERQIHQDNSSAAEHKAGLRVDEEGKSLWQTRAETALFRSRRAEALAILLRAKLVIQSHTGHTISAEEFRTRLRAGEPRQAIQSLLRRIKAERVGIAVVDISICGAVPPYAILTGGKLVAMLLASPEMVSAYCKRYANAESIIASSIAGRAIARPSHLVFLGTTSLYGTEPNQYTRVAVPCQELGGFHGESIRYYPLGRTEGYGTFQFSDNTVEALADAVAAHRGGKRVKSIFGEGVNPRLRKIRDGLDLLGLDSDQLLMHGNQRLVYGVPLARNFREYLLGRDAEPEYLFALSKVEDYTKGIANWWAERWLSKRIERDDVLNHVSEQRLTYPIRHGARVQIPHDDESPYLPFLEMTGSVPTDD